MKKVLFLLMLFVMMSTYVFADGIGDIMTDEVRDKIEESFEFSEDISGTDAIELIERLNKGDFDIGYDGIIDFVKSKFSDALDENIGFFMRIIVVILIISLIENMQFGRGSDKSVTLVCTSVVVLSLLTVFGNIAEYAAQTIDRLILFINSLIPVLLYLVAGMGRVATAGMLNPVMLGVSSVVSLIVKSVILPLASVSISLKLTDDITGKKHLGNFGKQVMTLIKWVTGFMLTIYIGIITVIGTAVPHVDDVTLKTTKYAVSNFIPYVGGMLTDSVDLIFSCSAVVKNSVGIAGLIGVLSVVAVPCISIAVKVLILNVLAAIVSPVAGKSVVSAFNSITSCLSIILGMVFVVAVMYILSVTVIIFIGGA